MYQNSNHNQPVLEIRGVSVGYGHKKHPKVVLENIDVSLFKGQLVCFMGQNGIGKSTLLRTISGVQKPLAGEILINDKPLHKYSRNEIAQRISLVLTERIQAGSLTAYDLVVMGRYPHTNWNITLTQQDQDKIAVAIRQTNISHLLNKSLYQLSDGQLQKVMIARALAQDGDIMILDEPTAHLDLNNRVEVIELLKSLAVNTNKAVLMATHELDLALQTADWLWLVRPEAPIVQGVPEDLVLTGELDRVFPMKGYDLKTGKMKPTKYKQKKIVLVGEGYVYLWTKNALERDGFEVVSDHGDAVVKIQTSDNKLIWMLEIGEKEEQKASILELLQHLEKQLLKSV